MKANGAHGRARELGADVVLEDEPLDEKPHAPPVGPDPITAGRDAGGRVRTSAAARALAKLPRSTAFRPRNIPVDDSFAYHYRERLRLLEQRAAEITRATGGCSSGVMLRLRKAAWAYAWSEYCDEYAAKNADTELAVRAAGLAEKADKFDWSAWTLACREGEKRPRDNSDLDRLLGRAT